MSAGTWVVLVLALLVLYVIAKTAVVVPQQSAYVVERLVMGGATSICMVISPGKSDILEYYGASFGPARLCYVVQPQASGLCDALFCALPLIGADDPVPTLCELHR